MRWLKEKTSRKAECSTEAVKEQKRRVASVAENGIKYNVRKTGV